MFRYFQINKNGHNIRCKLYCKNVRDIRRVVIAFHGFGGHKDNAATEKLAERLLSKYKAVAVIAFDWPCHGDDVKKKLCLQDCMTYLQLVTGYARQELQAEALYAYAISFGGYILLSYIREYGDPFQRVVLRSPAVNIYEAITTTIMTAADMEKLQKGKDTPVGFDRKVPISMQFLQQLQSRDIRTWDFLDYAEDILIIHGTADEIIPYEKACAFAEDNLIELVTVEGADHRFRDPRKMEEVIKRSVGFFGF